MGFQVALVVKKQKQKKPACQCRRHKRHGFDPWVGKIPWRGAWQPISILLAWRGPWTEEPGRLQSIGSQRVRHNLSDLAHTHACLLYDPNSVKSGCLLSIGN